MLPFLLYFWVHFHSFTNDNILQEYFEHSYFFLLSDLIPILLRTAARCGKTRMDKKNTTCILRVRRHVMCTFNDRNSSQNVYTSGNVSKRIAFCRGVKEMGETPKKNSYYIDHFRRTQCAQKKKCNFIRFEAIKGTRQSVGKRRRVGTYEHKIEENRQKGNLLLERLACHTCEST